MKKKKLANYKDPLISAIENNLISFDSLERARLKIAKLKSDYVISKKHDESDVDGMMLWIHDFRVSSSEREQGYRGNFALIQINKSKGKHFLTLEKVDIPIKNHPIKKRNKYKHPDWGHPILRKYVKKAWFFQNQQEARDTLASLYKLYPEVAIPATEDMLYIEVFSKQKDPPFHRIVILVEKDEISGSYLLNYYENHASSRWLDTKTYEQHDSVFTYAFGEKSVINQSFLSLADLPNADIEKE